MSVILLLKFFEVETGLYKILNFETPRFQIEVFKTEVTVDSGGQCSTHCLCFKINTRYKIINPVLNSRYILLGQINSKTLYFRFDFQLK